MGRILGELTLGIQLGALVEDTSTISTGAGTNQVGEEAAADARVDIGGVTGVGGPVAAGELSLVTALGLCLRDGHALGDLPANIVVLVLKAGHGRQSDSHGGESEGESGQRELHF